MTAAASPASQDLSELGFYILKSAVTLARDEQIPSLKALRARLASLFPGQPDEVETALRYWAQHLKESA